MRNPSIAALAALIIAMPAHAGVPPADRIAFGNIAATGTCPVNGGAVTLATDGMDTVGLDVRGTFTATLTLKATIDGTNYFAVNAVPQGGGTAVTSVTAAGQWYLDSNGWRSLCVYASAYTSGTAVITMEGSAGASSPEGATGAVAVEGLGTAGTATGGVVTVQLASGGAGVTTQTAIAPAATTLTAATATSVYAGAATTCGVDVTNSSTTIAMNCGTTSAVSATVGTYVPPLGTYSTPATYGGQIFCFPASGTPAASAQAWRCP